MRVFLLLASGVALLSGCDTAAKTFGKTYDECLLKNAAQTAAADICARHFERLRTFEERDGGMLSADGVVATIEGRERIVVTVTNNSRDKIASVYDVYAVFWSSEGSIPEDGFMRKLHALQYGFPLSETSHTAKIEPQQSATVELPIPAGAHPASVFTVDASITRVVPMRGK